MSKNRRHDIVKPSKYKTSMCTFFMSAEGCPFGERCAFAHGEAELRPEVQPTPAATSSSSSPSSAPVAVGDNGNEGGAAATTVDAAEGSSAMPPACRASTTATPGSCHTDPSTANVATGGTTPTSSSAPSQKPLPVDTGSTPVASITVPSAGGAVAAAAHTRAGRQARTKDPNKGKGGLTGNDSGHTSPAAAGGGGGGADSNSGSVSGGGSCRPHTPVTPNSGGSTGPRKKARNSATVSTNVQMPNSCSPTNHATFPAVTPPGTQPRGGTHKQKDRHAGRAQPQTVAVNATSTITSASQSSPTPPQPHTTSEGDPLSQSPPGGPDSGVGTAPLFIPTTMARTPFFNINDNHHPINAVADVNVVVGAGGVPLSAAKYSPPAVIESQTTPSPSAANAAQPQPASPGHGRGIMRYNTIARGSHLHRAGGGGQGPHPSNPTSLTGQQQQQQPFHTFPFDFVAAMQMATPPFPPPPPLPRQQQQQQQPPPQHTSMDASGSGGMPNLYVLPPGAPFANPAGAPSCFCFPMPGMMGPPAGGMGYQRNGSGPKQPPHAPQTSTYRKQQANGSSPHHVNLNQPPQQQQQQQPPANMTMQSLFSSNAPPTVVHIPLGQMMGGGCCGGLPGGKGPAEYGASWASSAAAYYNAQQQQQQPGVFRPDPGLLSSLLQQSQPISFTTTTGGDGAGGGPTTTLNAYPIAPTSLTSALFADSVFGGSGTGGGAASALPTAATTTAAGGSGGANGEIDAESEGVMNRLFQLFANTNGTAAGQSGASSANADDEEDGLAEGLSAAVERWLRGQQDGTSGSSSAFAMEAIPSGLLNSPPTAAVGAVSPSQPPPFSSSSGAAGKTRSETARTKSAAVAGSTGSNPVPPTVAGPALASTSITSLPSSATITATAAAADTAKAEGGAAHTGEKAATPPPAPLSVELLPSGADRPIVAALRSPVVLKVDEPMRKKQPITSSFFRRRSPPRPVESSNGGPADGAMPPRAPVAVSSAATSKTPAAVPTAAAVSASGSRTSTSTPKPRTMLCSVIKEGPHTPQNREPEDVTDANAIAESAQASTTSAAANGPILLYCPDNNTLFYITGSSGKGEGPVKLKENPALAAASAERGSEEATENTVRSDPSGATTEAGDCAEAAAASKAACKAAVKKAAAPGGHVFLCHKSKPKKLAMRGGDEDSDEEEDLEYAI